jgi:hypothetical protein
MYKQVADGETMLISSIPTTTADMSFLGALKEAEFGQLVQEDVRNEADPDDE